MWQPQEDNTYNDLRENSIRQWLEDMSRHEDVAGPRRRESHRGISGGSEEADPSVRGKMCIERCLFEEDEREGGTVRDHCPVFL